MDARDEFGIVHPGGADDADGTGGSVSDLVSGDDGGRVREFGEPVLGTDADLDARAASLSGRDQHGQRLFIAEELEERGQVVAVLLVPEQVGLSFQPDVCLRGHFGEVGDRGQQRGHGERFRSQRRCEGLDLDRVDVGERCSPELFLDQLVEGLFDVRRQCDIHAAGFALQDAGGGQEDHHGDFRTDRDHFDVFDERVLVGRCRREGRKVREVHERLAGFRQESFRVSGAFIDPGLDAPAVGLFQLLHLHQVIDIIPITALGRDAARGGVGLVDESLRSQGRHIVSDGGGGNVDVELRQQRFGTDRFAGLDVLFDDRRQDLLSSRR